MTPIYFPFTFVRPAAAAALTAAFDTVSLVVPAADGAFAPLAPGIDPAPWEVIVPAVQDDRSLESLETALRQWAERNAGADLAALMAGGGDEPPFFPETAVSHIRGQLRERMSGRQPEPAPDALTAARVFLRFAHALDREQWGMHEDMQSLAQMERDMIADLHGASRPVDALRFPGAAAQDPGAFLTERRLAAWGRLALAAGAGRRVLVTDSPAVAATLAEMFADLRPLFDIVPSAAGTADRGALQAALEEALSPAPVPSERPPLGVAPDLPAGRVLALEQAPEIVCRALAGGRRRGMPTAGDGRSLVVVLEGGGAV